MEGLRAAVSAALNYGLAAIELGEERAPLVPAELLAQARVAARSGVSLDTVLRRYFAGYTLLSDFLIQEVEDGDLLSHAVLQRVMRGPASVFDRLVSAVTDEYTREASGRFSSTEERRAERVRGLLAGELLDTSELAYELDAWHLGVLAVGLGADEAIRGLAATLDRRLLLVHDGEGAVWAWLGGRHRVDPQEIECLESSGWPVQVSLAVGEPARGLSGWRLTHRQARAALPVALRRPASIVRYADVALLASILQDDLLTASLQGLYLEPLSNEPDGGEVLRETLRAYFAAERNISSAAAAIGVSRRTVANRLRTVEERLGCSLRTISTEVEVALRIHDLTPTGAGGGSEAGDR
ncbi:MAG TPA: helix-turn-helix domain-containing protein [Solirubrobacterales bacterium]|nr:helix-turn-helix domain-containing protein [Solirubrobacterales bacterium]